MRRILTLRDNAGQIVGYRPLIQQGRGNHRKNHSTVFRISDRFTEELALLKAQQWRDRRETELGLVRGALSALASKTTESGVYLVVTKSAPYRALWSSKRLPTGRRLRVYIGKRSYQAAYEEALSLVAVALGQPSPTSYPPAPAPTGEQRSRIHELGIEFG